MLLRMFGSMLVNMRFELLRELKVSYELVRYQNKIILDYWSG